MKGSSAENLRGISRRGLQGGTLFLALANFEWVRHSCGCRAKVAEKLIFALDGKMLLALVFKLTMFCGARPLSFERVAPVLRRLREVGRAGWNLATILEQLGGQLFFCLAPALHARRVIGDVG